MAVDLFFDIQSAVYTAHVYDSKFLLVGHGLLLLGGTLCHASRGSWKSR